MKRRLFSILLVLCLMVTILPVSALAQEYDLANGSLTVSTGEGGAQYVTVGSGNGELQTSPTVIRSTGTTENTITVSTAEGTTADFTLEDVSVETSGKSVIDIGSSSANITLKGENELSTKNAAGIHVSSGSLTISGDGSLDVETEGNHAAIGSSIDEDMSGSIQITGDAEVTAKTINCEDAYAEGAAIGTGDRGDLSGSITIGGNAEVTAFSDCDGAGIGTGEDGGLTGTITIDGNAKVTAISDDDGAGIGTGRRGDIMEKGSITIGGNAEVTAVSDVDGAGIGTGYRGDIKNEGSVTIGGNAKVTAWSGEEGSGIGTGRRGDMSGTITIGGNATAIAASDDGAGIGRGEDGKITTTGRIIIGGYASVTAVGECSGCSIGSGGGESKPMDGIIVICDDAEVLALAGHHAAAIGSDYSDGVTGVIAILGRTKVTTGVVEDENDFDYESMTITYELEDGTGYIGDSDYSRHDSKYGAYLIDPDVTINGISGSDVEKLKDVVNMHLVDGEPRNLMLLQVRQSQGEFTAEMIGGTGQVGEILYDGEPTRPTEPGTYEVSCEITINGMTVQLPIGILEIRETATAETVDYRVTDGEGREISYTAQQDGSVLTITADAENAVLTGTLSGMKALQQQGVETVRFVTNGAVSSFRIADLLAQGSMMQRFSLCHNGVAVQLLLDGQDISGILTGAA